MMSYVRNFDASGAYCRVSSEWKVRYTQLASAPMYLRRFRSSRGRAKIMCRAGPRDRRLFQEVWLAHKLGKLCGLFVRKPTTVWPEVSNPMNQRHRGFGSTCSCHGKLLAIAIEPMFCNFCRPYVKQDDQGDRWIKECWEWGKAENG